MRKQRYHLSVLISFLLIPLVLFLSVWPGVYAAGLPPEKEFEKALTLYQKKDYAEALKAFQKLEAEFPSHSMRPDVLFMQAHALRALQRWDKAAEFFARAAEVHPSLADYALYYLGETSQMAGNREKSLESFGRLVSLYPKSLLVPQARLKMAELYCQAGEYFRSAEISENVLRENAGKNYSAQALFILGQAREGQEQWPKAVKTYQELWLKYPLNPLAKKAKIRWEVLVKEKNFIEEKIAPEALLRRALQFCQAHLHEAALSEMEGVEGFSPRAYPRSYTGERWIDELYLSRALCLFHLKQYSKSAEACIVVINHSRNEETAEKALFWMIKALFRSGRKEEALNLLLLFQNTYPRSVFMDQALLLKAQIYEEQGNSLQAVSVYRELSDTFPQSTLRFAAIWQSGWLLFKNQDYLQAFQIWDGLQALNPNSPWVEKILYWKGRALGEKGRTQEAEGYDQQLLKHYPASYYGQRIAQKTSFMAGKKGPTSLQDQLLSPFYDLKARSGISHPTHLEKGRALACLGLLSGAVEELEAAEEEGRGVKEIRLEVARLYRELKEYHRSALLVRRNFNLKPSAGRFSENERALYLLAYPLGHASWVQQYAQNRKLDPALLFAVILEESRFNPQTLSIAGARGLMQVLPSTARQIVQKINLHPYSDTLLFDPETNLRLGSWYLAWLLEEFGGKETLALAAYNAGPHMVRDWLAKNPALKEDEFVENIPFAETRNYVVRVLGSAQVYRMLYDSSKNSARP